MTSSELQDAIITALTRKSGGTRRQWRMALGPIRLLDPKTHTHCNWSASPSGHAREIEQIERVLDDVRLAHPLISAG